MIVRLRPIVVRLFYFSKFTWKSLSAFYYTYRKQKFIIIFIDMNWKIWIVKKSWWVIFDGEKFFAVKRNNYNDISLPKWHIDPGETPEQAALREVLEETGFQCQIVWDLGTTEYLNFEWIVQVQYFAMRVNEKVTDKLFPDVDEVIVWSYDKIERLLSYSTDKKILEKWLNFFRWIK